MASVYTDLGPGEVTETKTVRGRTSYRVAGHDGSFDMWFDGTKLGFADVDHSNSVNLPYNPQPQYGVGALTDSTIQPIHEIDPDKRLHPADSQSFESRGESEAGDEPGPASHLFAAGIGISLPSHGGMEMDRQDAHNEWVNQHAGPDGDSYSHESPYWDESMGDDPRMAEDQGPMADEWGGSGQFDDAQSPISADHWRSTDAEMNRFGYRQADVLEGAPQRFEPNFIVNDTDDEFLHDEDVEADERETTGPDQIVHFASTQHQGWAAVVPAVARGVGMGAAEQVLQDKGQGGQNPEGGQDAGPSGMDTVQDAMGNFDPNNPLPLPGLEGTGWGDLTTKHGHNLDDRYASIIEATPHDIVAQFRNDPEAIINRIGHAESEGLNPRFAQYGELVDADESLRTAAWRDVRAKATRLRKQGRVHVKDVGPDRIYASVQGDHGTYDVMIKKGGAFGGFGGGHAVSNWHCSCEWGKWAFQRQFKFIGRLCSHGLASYHEMQSQHLKGVSQKRKRVNPRNARVAHDQTPEDWRLDQDSDALPDLQKLRGWAEQTHDTWNGEQADHVDDVQDAVERAREEGVDASQLVASLMREAAPGDTNELLDQMGYPSAPASPPLAANPFAGGGYDLSKAPGVSGSPNTNAPSGGSLAGTPTGDLISRGQPSAPSAPAAPSSGGNSQGIQGPGIPGNPGTPAAPASGNSQGIQGPGIPGNPGGPAESAPASDSIGQGDYTIQSGDTLSDIAQRAGYGDNYQALGDQNSIGNYDQINAGDTIKIGDPAAPGAPATPGGGGNSDASNPATPAPDQSPGGGQSSTPAGDADSAAASTPAADPAAPVALDAASGGGSSSGVDTSAASNPATSGNGAPEMSDTGSPGTDTSSDGSASSMSSGSDALNSGMDALSSLGSGDLAGAISSGAEALSGLGKSSMHQLMADRDWFEAAYPDAKFEDHRPFNGSGGIDITEWGQSKDNVKENYSDNLQDVTEVPNKTYLKQTEPLADLREGREASVGGGIKRAGQGPMRPAVEPEVVRVRGPRKAAVAVEAEHVIDDFDPLAPRTAASFDDPYASADDDARAVMAAANASPRDIVAQFQASGGGAVFASGQESGGQFDDFSNSPAVRQAMQRTAGRHFSPAEQEALIREGDKGGAGNLGSLDLAGTHYEAMNSVGLW